MRIVVNRMELYQKNEYTVTLALNREEYSEYRIKSNQ